MCGRYTHKLTWQQIVNLYRLTLPEEEPPGLRQSYNVAPTDVMPIIRPAGNGRELVMAGWGLVPFWLKPDQLGKRPYSTINAREETIQTAPTYREPFQKRRCLVPASGWYEWQKVDEKGKKKKRPYHFKPKAEPFALAGVYDVWKGDAGRAITSFAIVTTDAALSVAQYHNRMPVVLDEAQFDDWMRGTRDQAAEMMKPYAGEIEAWEVCPDVGNVRNNRPDLMDRVGLL
jgi:putative SOS response-associated peptidase YedK